MRRRLLASFVPQSIVSVQPRVVRHSAVIFVGADYDLHLLVPSTGDRMAFGQHLEGMVVRTTPHLFENVSGWRANTAVQPSRAERLPRRGRGLSAVNHSASTTITRLDPASWPDCAATLEGHACRPPADHVARRRHTETTELHCPWHIHEGDTRRRHPDAFAQSARRNVRSRPELLATSLARSLCRPRVDTR